MIVLMFSKSSFEHHALLQRTWLVPLVDSFNCPPRSIDIRQILNKDNKTNRPQDMVKVRSRSQKESVSSYHMKSIELIISHKLF